MAKAWIVTADMGYGHQRAAYPLRDIAIRIINSNKDNNLTVKEKRLWNYAKGFYETISRFSDIPVFGRPLFRLYDKLQRIAPFYPFKDRSAPSMGARLLARMASKGFLAGIILYMKSDPRPLVATIFFPAIVANHHSIPSIYCVVTDSDINRIWVPVNPKESKIIYFIPAERTRARLLQYGVLEEKIVLTGFPLPKELTGRNDSIAKKILAIRLPLLDPNRRFLKYHSSIISKELKHPLRKRKRPMMISFMIGGAGAQSRSARLFLKSISPYVKKKEYNISIIVGTHMALREEFLKLSKELGVEEGVRIVYGLSKLEYFKECSRALEDTDVIITKPSEMIFYAALGIPIFMLPPIGAHERSNRDYIIELGCGLDIHNIRSFHYRLSDLKNNGTLARMAWNGYTNMIRHGTYEIERIIRKA